MEKYCSYYQAHVKKVEQWFLVAVLRSFEHTCFDRTLDKEQGIFEFYVPEEMEWRFCKLMDYFIQQGIVVNLQKLPNRLIVPGTEL